MSGDRAREEIAAALYPGLFPDEAERRHPQQFRRVAALLDRLAEERGRETAAEREAPSWVEAVTPTEIARQRSLDWPDFHPEDFCHRCGRRNPTWFADTEQWREATHSTDDGGGILCPSCFCALWEVETGKTAIIWRLLVDGRRAGPVMTRDTECDPSLWCRFVEWLDGWWRR